MSISTSVETLRAGSVGVAATVGLTATDLVTYLTALFIAFQVLAITPKLWEAVKYWKRGGKGNAGE